MIFTTLRLPSRLFFCRLRRLLPYPQDSEENNNVICDAATRYAAARRHAMLRRFRQHYSALMLRHITRC